MKVLFLKINVRYFDMKVLFLKINVRYFDMKVLFLREIVLDVLLF
jgi:hypothetical protein